MLFDDTYFMICMECRYWGQLQRRRNQALLLAGG